MGRVHAHRVAPGSYAFHRPAYAHETDHHRREHTDDGGLNARFRHYARLREFQRAVLVAAGHERRHPTLAGLLPEVPPESRQKMFRGVSVLEAGDNYRCLSGRVGFRRHLPIIPHAGPGMHQ